MNRYMSIVGLTVALLWSFGSEVVIGDDDMHKEQTFSVAIKVPDPSWAIQIQQVLLVDKGYILVSRLTKSDGMTMQMITRARDKVTFKGPNAAVLHHYITGKTWGWENKEPVTFVAGDAELKKRLPENAEVMFSR